MSVKAASTQCRATASLSKIGWLTLAPEIKLILTACITGSFGRVTVTPIRLVRVGNIRAYFSTNQDYGARCRPRQDYPARVSGTPRVRSTSQGGRGLMVFAADGQALNSNFNSQFSVDITINIFSDIRINKMKNLEIENWKLKIIHTP